MTKGMKNKFNHPKTEKTPNKAGPKNADTSAPRIGQKIQSTSDKPDKKLANSNDSQRN